MLIEIRSKQTWKYSFVKSIKETSQEADTMFLGCWAAPKMEGMYESTREKNYFAFDHHKLLLSTSVSRQIFI